MRTRLWRFHLGGGCALALVYAYLPYPPLRIGAMVVLCLATIAATLAAIRLWRPARRAPFPLFAAGEAVGFAAGAFGSSAAVTRARGNVAAAALTCVVYLIGIVGYALLIRTRSPGRDRASLIDATVISTGVGMLAWVFLAAPYSADTSLPLVERVLSIPTSRSWTAWPGGARSRRWPGPSSPWPGPCTWTPWPRRRTRRAGRRPGRAGLPPRPELPLLPAGSRRRHGPPGRPAPGRRTQPPGLNSLIGR